MRFFILLEDSCLRSKRLTPTKLSKSEIKQLLMVKSRGESQAKDGDKLISTSQGFKSESMSMS